MTYSSTRTRIVGPESRRPLLQSRGARVVLVLAWVVFWGNTALLPCCEALAAAFDDHSDSVSHSTSAGQPEHHSEETHTGHLNQAPSSHCDATLNAPPAIDGTSAALPIYRVDLDGFVTATPLTPGLPAVNHSASVAPRDYHPPPPFRRYLDSQRLLI